ncbi:uracil-DNA glycosylase family protein [Sulfurovum sp.]|uniref:uracil-DNA glycosylase family protein n=1 Tax=Sulfurovum sp. TaxID=1969726 RepID=UPI0025F916D3|nr:uracil-DNA glycosylase family protein [Sulfurovum sp.]
MPSDNWDYILKEAYEELEADYRFFLEENTAYIPNKENYLNAFKTLPKEKVNYILFGQDPYPRAESASGYAFIDARVKTIFSEKGLSKEVNRATSLRNFVKMALLARGDLSPDDLSQDAIAALDKTAFISSIGELRCNFERNGVLLLNTALVFTDKKSSARHVKAWRPFVQSLLHSLEPQAPKLILFGNHAKELKKHLPLENFETIELEHPYNHTFITNSKALDLFGPMQLLDK